MTDTFDSDIFHDEAVLAHLAYRDWARSDAESMSEFVHRRRTVNLSVLVRDAIENVLSENEKTVIRMFYYDKLSASQISNRLCLNKSTVTRTLSRAEEKLQKALGYVVRYQQGMMDVPCLPVAVRQAMMVDAARLGKWSDFPGEILRRMQAENISESTLSKGLELSAEHLHNILSGSDNPSPTEIVQFAAFFGVSTDALLKGAEHEHKIPS